MTIETAFRQVFGEALKDHGFVKIKGRHPIFARCINNEIVHVITFRKSYLGKEFCIICGVATVYRAELRFPESRKELETDIDWFDMMYQFEGLKRVASIWYSDQTLTDSMKYALSLTEKVIIPALDDVLDIKGCTEYYLTMQRFFGSLSLRELYENKEFAVKYPKDRENEAMLWLLLDDREYFRELCGQWYDMRLRQIELCEKDGSWGNDLGSDRAAARQRHADRLAYYDKVFADKEWLSAAHAELERRRAHNLQTLKEYGLITEE